MGRQYHPTTEEQTRNKYDFVPFGMSQNLEDQSKVAALLKEHQMYAKPYRLLSTCSSFLSQ
jgi:hypothetical protein